MRSRREEDYWLPAYRKRELRKKVKSRERDSMTENRRTRRAVQKKIRDGSINDVFTTPIDKPGKYFKDAWKSSGEFKRAYRYARSEAEFYDMARYADY